MLIVAAVVALGVGYYVPQTFSAQVDSIQPRPRRPRRQAPKAQPKSRVGCLAPGRVEPLGGEVRIAAQAPGRIAEVLVAINDKVRQATCWCGWRRDWSRA